MQIQRIYVPRNFMFVFEYMNYHETTSCSKNKKKKQNLRILSKPYPYLQAMTKAHTDVS